MHTLKKNANNNKLAESRKARSINEDEWSTDVKKISLILQIWVHAILHEGISN